MKLIIGGAYQGKHAFAKEKFGFSEEQIFLCTDTAIDFSRPCIDRLEEYVLAFVQAGIDPLEKLKQQELSDKVIICMDIFCGVVPIDATMRLWRHTTGLVCQYLAKNADNVYRIYCGVEQKLK